MLRINILGKTEKINPKSFDPNIQFMRFLELFHDSNIPTFHTVGIIPTSLENA